MTELEELKKRYERIKDQIDNYVSPEMREVLYEIMALVEALGYKKCKYHNSTQKKEKVDERT